MRYVAVLPYVWKPYFDDCVATMRPDFKKNVLIIDNTVNNIGIMASHNKGIDHMKAQGADWLIIISAAVRFGEAGGMDFIQQINRHPDHHVIHAASLNTKAGGHNEVKGWHLTAFHKSVFEAIGTWDCNFSNYGFDDIDLSIRIRKGIPDVVWEGYTCDVHDARMSHSIHFKPELVGSPSTPRIMYFQRKWGRHPGEWQKEAYDNPFNNPDHPLSYWPEPYDPLSIQNNEFVKLGGDRNV